MEEAVCCYICYEFENKNNNYLKEPSPCKCKGSITIHKDCLNEVLKTSRNCSICKTKYNMMYLPNRNGLELMIEEAINGDITEYTIDELGNKQGEHIIKKQSGQLISKSNYNLGKLHGEYTTWYDNNQVECVCNCVDNHIEGEYKSWYDNGILMEHTFYKDGMKEGISKRWNNEGELRQSRKYYRGEIID